MYRLDPSNVSNWLVGKKTKSIKAKPLISVVVDNSVLSKFLLNTLEGREPLGDGAVLCVGESNDIWQQMPKKLLDKYSVTGLTNDGWMICEPRGINTVQVHEITNEDVNNTSEQCYIVCEWGEVVDDEMIQRGSVGDFICKSRTDPNDVWIVERKIFNNTYVILD